VPPRNDTIRPRCHRERSAAIWGLGWVPPLAEIASSFLLAMTLFGHGVIASEVRRSGVEVGCRHWFEIASSCLLAMTQSGHGVIASVARRSGVEVGCHRRLEIASSQAPRNDTIQAPRNDTGQASRNGTVRAPRNSAGWVYSRRLK
jgi:hypothetical protein